MNKRIKIAIVTLHRVYNYGSVLQAYATQRIFEERGCNVVIVDYITEQRTKKRLIFGVPFTISRNFVRNVRSFILRIGSVMLQEMTFGLFIHKYLHLTKKYITVDDLLADPPKADIYVTGSDQTWNSKYNEGVDRGFFLDFLPKDVKRIAFASSFGKTNLDDDEREETRRLLSFYSKISVREDSAVKIIEDLNLPRPIQLVDPTLMLCKDEWKKIATHRLVKQPYLILMLFYGEDNHATEYARMIANEKGLKLVKLSLELKKPKMVDKLMTHRTPADFLSLFNYANYVVTNSFHGLAFSINFEKEFIIIPRNEFNSRIESLLRLCGLEDRLVHSLEEVSIQANKVIDYSSVNQVLKKERGKVKIFLDDVLKYECKEI